MNEQFIWNIEYNTRKINDALDSVDSVLKKTSPARMPLDITIEEVYRLREALTSIRVHNQMNENDLEVAVNNTPKNRIKKLFHRK